jgi:hypothetical protein
MSCRCPESPTGRLHALIGRLRHSVGAQRRNDLVGSVEMDEVPELLVGRPDRCRDLLLREPPEDVLFFEGVNAAVRGVGG